MWKEMFGWCMPRGRWLLAALALVLAAAVATPIVAQDATITRWTLPVHPNRLALDPSGLVWATASSAPDQMFRLDPVNDQVTTYTHDFALGDSYGAVVDSGGLVWFTANTVGGYRINRLDPGTGNITGWPVAESGYAVALDTLSNDIWFNCGSALCKLDSDTNTITSWTLASKPTAIFVDPDGKVWHVRADAMKVGVLDPLTNSLTQWSAPGTMMSSTAQTIFVDGAGKVWFTVWVHSGNQVTGGEVVRLDPATNEMTEWPCPPGACFGPTAVLVDGGGMVWFTEWGPYYATSCGGSYGYINRLDPTADPPLFTRWQVGNYCPDQILSDAAGAMWIKYQYYNTKYIDRFQP